jgi:hypothetical protein
MRKSLESRFDSDFHLVRLGLLSRHSLWRRRTLAFTLRVLSWPKEQALKSNKAISPPYPSHASDDAPN